MLCGGTRRMNRDLTEGLLDHASQTGFVFLTVWEKVNTDHTHYGQLVLFEGRDLTSNRFSKEKDEAE